MNNTFNDIVISNLTKSYNITCARFSIQYYIFQDKTTILFLNKSSISKNNNKNFQPLKTKNFNLQILWINKQTWYNLLALPLNWKKYLNYLTHDMVIASPKN